MALDLVQLLGLAAACLTTVSFVPQAIKAIRTKHTKDLSLSMLVLLTSGCLLWFIYGILRNDLPLILANLVTLSLDALILGLKIRYG